MRHGLSGAGDVCCDNIAYNGRFIDKYTISHIEVEEH
jgi:hypothetical protein